MGVVVVDEDGEWTGTQNEGLEIFSGLSGLTKNEDGFKSILCGWFNRRSKYIYWMDHDSTGDFIAHDSNFSLGNSPIIWYRYPNGTIVSESLIGGVDGTDVSDGDKITGFQ